MTDILDTASSWLTSMNRTHRGRTVTYVRGDMTAQVTSVVGRTVFQVPREYGLFEEVETRDYLIEVSDLADFSEPAAGDQVKDTLNGTVQIFEVMAPGDEPVFRYADLFRRVFRIHTKHVGSVA